MPRQKKLAEQQFHTLRDFYLKLADGVIIYPGHGHGSPCGADIGDRLSSTIGYERRFNAFLQFQDVKASPTTRSPPRRPPRLIIRA
jgi:hydroxyacylglutathione hydrolase